MPLFFLFKLLCSILSYAFVWVFLKSSKVNKHKWCVHIVCQFDFTKIPRGEFRVYDPGDESGLKLYSVAGWIVRYFRIWHDFLVPILIYSFVWSSDTACMNQRKGNKSLCTSIQLSLLLLLSSPSCLENCPLSHLEKRKLHIEEHGTLCT
jgi:hypothetical protein